MKLGNALGLVVLCGSISAGLSWCDEAKPVSAQQEKTFEGQVTIKVKLRYLLFLPQGYDAKGEKKWPLILFLHGSGESGNDLSKVKKHGPPKIVEERRDLPFIVVSPQSPRGGWNPDALNGLLENVLASYKVDRDRVYLTGLSMGGFGTWTLAAAHPERFAAIVPICGGGNPADAARLKDLPIWVFHGAKDRTVPLQRSEVMVDAIRKAGGNPKLTVYPEAGHDSWTQAYTDPELYKWLLKHRRKAAGRAALKEGERVILLGSTIIEREQRSGYWETALTRLNPDKRLIFRNLGWSGDNVFGEARAAFGSVADGFRQLKEHVLANKPSLIIVDYGQNESFQGKAGLPEFLRGLDVLLDTLAASKARIVLLSPLRQEDMGRPLPDPSAQNKNVRLYCDALRKVADRRGYPFVDLFDLLEQRIAKSELPLTDNGIHPSSYGYWRTGPIIAGSFGLTSPAWKVEIDKDGSVVAQGARASMVQGHGIELLVTDAALPAPPPPPFSPAGATQAGAERLLRVAGLNPGKYSLRIDGKPVAAATAEDWAAGVTLTSGPAFDQVEKLRKAIVAKNLLYFHRWRPENETYLFGFRKHEQGQNAKEVAQFDPLIASAEAVVARLRVPVAHKYELVPQ